MNKQKSGYRIKIIFTLLLVVPFSLTRLSAQETTASVDKKEYDKVVARAIDFLRKSQAADGSFSRNFGPGVTGLVISSALRHGLKPDDEMIAKGLKYLEAFIRKDGGVYAEKSLYRNYETCIAMMAFADANQNGKYDKILGKAKSFVKKIQWGGPEDSDAAKMEYGGAGYGKHGRPDLSNTSFLVDALKKTMDEKSESDKVALQRALKFISRTQNKYSEHNSTEFARKASKEDQGGFYYTPANGGESKAGKTADGGLRSYASMTYAGLKSMIYAGVRKDDPRIKAAIEWITRHYDLKSNPGVGQQGLFYYYQVFAKSLDALGEEVVTDKDGKKHHWRAELFTVLKSLQRADGSWINPKSSRWEEGNPTLVTAYSLLALSYCQKNDTRKKK